MYDLGMFEMIEPDQIKERERETVTERQSIWEEKKYTKSIHSSVRQISGEPN